jgi:hypothetical protein
LDSVELGVEILCALQSLYPGMFQLDPALLMVGSRAALQSIRDGQAPAKIVADWQPPLEAFKRLRENYILYPE